MRTLGLAIPTWQRTTMLFEAFASVEQDPRVATITIVDDASQAQVVQQLQDRRGPKWQLILNGTNVGCYQNKRRAVITSNEEWVVQFDSDNVIGPGYLDALYAIPEWDPDTLYVPVFARPAFDYREYSGVTIDGKNLASYFDRPRFSTALNTGNFFVNRASYLAVHDWSTDPMAADSMYFCWCWIKSGRRMLFVPGLEYDHRIHDGNYVQYAERSAEFFRRLAEQMRAYGS